MENPYSQAPRHNSQSFEEYYTYYLTEHIDIKNRGLHLLGTIFMFYYIWSAISRFSFIDLIFALVISALFDAAGHTLFEGKLDSHTCNYVFSIKADVMLLYHTANGQINDRIT